MDFNDKINELKEQTDKAKTEKIRLEERLSNVSKEEKEILSELKELKINPEELESKINALEKEINKELETLSNETTN